MTTPSHESQRALQRAVDSLESATYDLQGGFILASVNRSYYTCFYCMIALLYTRNLHPKTHSGVRSKFSELFVKTNIFPVSVADDIANLFGYRQEADYDLDADISVEEAKELVQKAYQFLQLTKKYFDTLNCQ